MHANCYHLSSAGSDSCDTEDFNLAWSPPSPILPHSSVPPPPPAAICTVRTIRDDLAALQVNIIMDHKLHPRFENSDAGSISDSSDLTKDTRSHRVLAEDTKGRPQRSWIFRRVRARSQYSQQVYIPLDNVPRLLSPSLSSLLMTRPLMPQSAPRRTGAGG